MGFPLDWDDWQKEWREWSKAHDDDLKPTRERFDGKNFLADDVLGTWRVKGQVVELSEVTFPNLSERDPKTGRLIDKRIRYIGLTFAKDAGEYGPTIVGSFAELEHELGLNPQPLPLVT